MVDFIVVGGGLSGMLAARELIAGGGRVILLERGELGKEASWAGGGILSPLHPWRNDDALTALARWSQRHYPGLAAELLEETGIDPEWLPSGLLIAEQGEAQGAVAWAHRWGVTLETVTGNRLMELEPGLAPPGDGGGMYLPEVAQIRTPRLLKALARSLALRDVVIREYAEVVELIEQGDRVIGVRTRAETLHGGAVVVTAGAWTAAMLGPLGLDSRIIPVRGQMLLFHAAPGQVRHILEKGEHYLVPRRDGRVLAGSTLEYVGFDKSTTPQAYDELYAAATALVPGLMECPVGQHWAGLRPGSAQGIPLIGRHPRRRGLYLNAGHFRNGVVTGPASARLLADLIFDREPCVDPAAFGMPMA